MLDSSNYSVGLGDIEVLSYDYCQQRHANIALEYLASSTCVL